MGLPGSIRRRATPRHVPTLIQYTWLLPIAPMVPSQVFGTNKTKVVHCRPGIAVVNPEYQLQHVSDMTLSPRAGISAQNFASWYMDLRGHGARSVARSQRMSPWVVRGLRVAIIESDE